MLQKYRKADKSSLGVSGKEVSISENHIIQIKCYSWTIQCYFYDIYLIKYYTMRIKRTNYRHIFPKEEFTRQITILASNMVLKVHKAIN